LCLQINELEAVYVKGVDFPLQGPFGSEENPEGRLLETSYSLPRHPKENLRFTWEAGSFCQVNLEQNSHLIRTVLDLAKVAKDETVLDLYCGMGNFSIPLGMLCKQVTGIEGQGSAIRSAKRNAQINGVTNTGFYKSPVHRECSKLTSEGIQFDCVIIDPPRQGAPDLGKELAALATKRIVYISCDPATLSRDLSGLVSRGFTISVIQPVDMFPQTHHIETVVLLEK
jgi:23S rRNA (uracil1939-C5)-methyltransferase